MENELTPNTENSSPENAAPEASAPEAAQEAAVTELSIEEISVPESPIADTSAIEVSKLEGSGTEGSSVTPPKTDAPSRWPRKKLAIAAGLSLAFILFVAGSIGASLIFLSRVAEVPGLPTVLPQATEGPRTAAANAISVAADPAEQQKAEVPDKPASDSRFAFLLMGYGGGGHDGAWLTDSMMVAIVDPDRKTVSLLSIPRDVWAPLSFSDKTTVYNKVNTAYAFARDKSLYTDRLPKYQGDQGAGTFAMDTVARLTGIPTSYYLAVDFAGFRQAIDAVGGIDVEVPNGFTANYPANDDPAVDPSWIIVRFQKGQQHMDGERAIRYARAREVLDDWTEGSDFARSRRQKLIMEAFKEKLFLPEGLVHFPQLLTVASRHLDTNYTLPSAVQVAQLALDWKNVHFYQASLTNENYLTDSNGPEGTYILAPTTPDRSWAQIRAFARKLWQDPELGVAMVNTEVVVENDTGVSGVGGQIGSILSKLGYRVGTPVSGTTSPRSGIVDMTGGDGSVLVKALQADLKAQLEATEGDSLAGTPKVTLKVGTDYLSLANLAVPDDTSAPASQVGVWRIAPRPVEVAIQPTATPVRPSPSRTTTPQGTISPSIRGTASPAGTAAPRRFPAGTPSPVTTASPNRPGSIPVPTVATPRPNSTPGPSVPTPVPAPPTPVRTAVPAPTTAPQGNVAPTPTAVRH